MWMSAAGSAERGRAEALKLCPSVYCLPHTTKFCNGCEQCVVGQSATIDCFSVLAVNFNGVFSDIIVVCDENVGLYQGETVTAI